jgi:hypothetical protein
MPNFGLWIIQVIICLGSVLFMLKLFGRFGLFISTIIFAMIVNIQTVFQYEMFGLIFVGGNLSYAALYLVSDLISELYGKKAAVKTVWAGFVSIIAMTGFMQILLLFTPAPTDFASGALHTIFGFMPRIALGSLIAYVISQRLDVSLFHWYKKKTKGKHLWLRNNGSTLVSQFIDSIIFFHITYMFTIPYNVLWTLIMTTYMMKFIIGLLDTPFMYLGIKIMVKSQGRGWFEVLSYSKLENEYDTGVYENELNY